MHRSYPGILVAIEGVDGSGKSTLARNIAAALINIQQQTVVLTKEPGDTPLGTQLRSILQAPPAPLTPKAEYLLFAANRAEHFATVIMPHLRDGALIISDRMADSSLVYQGYARGLDLAMICMINDWTMNGIKPDLVLYVQVTLGDVLTRLAYRNQTRTIFEQETAFIQKVIDGFNTIFSGRPDVVTLDGTLDQQALTTAALARIETYAKHHRAS